jgi:hypothetical protein
MKIETKFDLGQDVWLVKEFPKHMTISCPGCEGRGDITLADGTTSHCPKCYGNKTQVRVDPADWHVTGPMTIGNVRVSLFGVQSGEDEHEDERMYMCRETGIGSGTLWREPDLFATREEAEAEAGKRQERGDK